MDISVVRALYDEDQRKAIEYPGQRREAGPIFVRHVDVAAAGQGAVIYSQLDEASADAAIRAQIDYFTGLQQDFEWKVYDHDRPADLKDRLRAYGFEVGESEAIMALDLEEAPPALWQPASQEVRRIRRAEDLADVMSVQRQVWNEDFAGLEQYLGEALRSAPGRMSVYVAYAGGQPASAAWIYFPEHSQFASLWGGSTVEARRGQGLYTALLALRAQEARGRGVRYLTVDASPMSRPILEKFGFALLAYSWPCLWRCLPPEAASST